MQRQAEENVLPPEMSSKGSITPRQVGSIPVQEKPEHARQPEEAKFQKLAPAAAPSRISRASRAQAALRAQASQQLREKVFKNMSQRAAEMLREDLEGKGPVRVSEVEAAQKEILKIVRRLAEEGQIVLPGKGGEEGFV